MTATPPPSSFSGEVNRGDVWKRMNASRGQLPPITWILNGVGLGIGFVAFLVAAEWWFAGSVGVWTVASFLEGVVRVRTAVALRRHSRTLAQG